VRIWSMVFASTLMGNRGDASGRVSCGWAMVQARALPVPVSVPVPRSARQAKLTVKPGCPCPSDRADQGRPFRKTETETETETDDAAKRPADAKRYGPGERALDSWPSSPCRWGASIRGEPSRDRAPEPAGGLGRWRPCTRAPAAKQHQGPESPRPRRTNHDGADPPPAVAVASRRARSPASPPAEPDQVTVAITRHHARSGSGAADARDSGRASTRRGRTAIPRRHQRGEGPPAIRPAGRRRSETPRQAGEPAEPRMSQRPPAKTT